MDLMSSISVSSSAMNAQSQRMKIISENIANADSLQTEAGGPYRRQIINFKTVLDKQTGAQKVEVGAVTPDMQTPLKAVFDPAHPLANQTGFVEYPNVNTMLENVDMREATRAYEANMAAIESAKEMMTRSLDLLR